MSTSTSRPRLDRQKITIAAVGMADAGGLAAVTMRSLADHLGVTPMALYKHIAHRAELVDGMLDTVLAAGDAGVSAGEWMEVVRRRILAARGVLRAHPWVREAIETRDHATPRTLGHMNALVAAMFQGGLSADLVHHAMHALSTRMWGFTRDVLPTPAVPEDPARRAEAMAEFASRYPAIIRMATTSPHAGLACDDDAEFHFALDLILVGIQRLHDAGWQRTIAPRDLLVS